MENAEELRSSWTIIQSAGTFPKQKMAKNGGFQVDMQQEYIMQN
jgi:hypothetical protein